MTFFQINLALASLTLVLASLMGGCLLYSMQIIKAKINEKEGK
jgi:hypothetical protein